MQVLAHREALSDLWAKEAFDPDIHRISADHNASEWSKPSARIEEDDETAIEPLNDDDEIDITTWLMDRHMNWVKALKTLFIPINEPIGDARQEQSTAQHSTVLVQPPLPHPQPSRTPAESGPQAQDEAEDPDSHPIVDNVFIDKLRRLEDAGQAYSLTEQAREHLKDEGILPLQLPLSDDSSWASENYNGGSCDPTSSESDEQTPPHVSDRPAGSTADGRACTDDDSPRRDIPTTRYKATSQSKPKSRN